MNLLSKTAESPDVVLRYDGLTVSFAGRTRTTEVVHGISFEVRRGEIVALVGESGSGKTVTALAAARLLPRQASLGGHIWLDGIDLVAMPERDLRKVRGNRIGMIFQDPVGALDPVFTIGNQLIEAIKRHRTDLDHKAAHARAVELLTMVGIPEPDRRMGFYPHQFSGGQCQRIMIAMALSCEPDILIADEPTTALDVTVQQEVLDVLAELRGRVNTSILLITHDMGVVADLADRVVVMRHGEIVEDGAAQQIFHRPEAAYTRALLQAVPRIGEQPEPRTRSAGTAVLEISDLAVTYAAKRRTVEAVRGVSLSIKAGETLGLVGESGSGKSTIGRAVIGLAPITAGTVRVGEHLVTDKDRRTLRSIRQQIGTVFQNPAGSLNPRYTVGTAIGEPAAVHRGMRGPTLTAHVAQLLDSVQLPAGWADRYPHELSGGQRQRVSIARALCLEPALLIADEPTSALDVSVQAKVLDLLTELQAERNFACLFISHDLAVVDQVCQRVAVMKDGLLVEQGAVRSVLSEPDHEYTQQLLDSAPIPDPAVQQRRRSERLAG